MTSLPPPPASGPYEDTAVQQIADVSREWSMNNPGNLAVKFMFIAEGDTEPGLIRGVIVKTLTKQIVICVQLAEGDPLPKEGWMHFGPGAKKLYFFQLEKMVVREKSREVHMPDMAPFIAAFTESNKQTREASQAQGDLMTKVIEGIRDNTTAVAKSQRLKTESIN